MDDSIGDANGIPGHLTFSKSNAPVIGALLDYVETNLKYLRCKTFARSESLNLKPPRVIRSTTFVSAVCLLLGMVCNVKFEVATFENEPLPNDLHFVLISEVDKLYIQDIDVTRVVWCIEASDTLVIIISTLLIWNSSYVRSPLSEYLFLPWLGAALRGLVWRQAPTAVALVYTVLVVDGSVDPLFVITFIFLFLIEARLWLAIARLVRLRWERRCNLDIKRHSQHEVQTQRTNNDAQSLEVDNYVY